MAVRMGKRGLVCALLFMYAILPRIMAGKTHKVGDSEGWTTGVDYDEWASGETFRVGDKLVFKYKEDEHTVEEVSEEDYNSCSAENPISRGTGGKTTFVLSDPGTQYFICGEEGHCSDDGMKLAVTVIDKNDKDDDNGPDFDTPPSNSTDGGMSSSSRAFSSSPLLVATSVVPFLFLL